MCANSVVIKQEISYQVKYCQIQKIRKKKKEDKRKCKAKQKKEMFVVQKEAGRFLVIYYFLLHAFFYTLLPSPRDTFELLGHGML